MMSSGIDAGLLRRVIFGLVASLLLGTAGPRGAVGQTMPGPVYHDLAGSGHEKLAKKIAKKLELRADPDDEDVQSLLDRWVREEGGPDSGHDWVAVTRLWLRAGDPVRADSALLRAEAAGEVSPGVLLLDQARVAFLADRSAVGLEAYWKGCDVSGEDASIEYWLDLEPLATPAEIEEWDRFRRLPISQRDLCQFLRRFWAERALASSMSVAERLDVHYDRLRHALDTYRRRGGKKSPGFSNRLGRPPNAAYDDRGLLFLRMGDPDRVTTYAGNPEPGQSMAGPECYQPNVSWAYDYPQGTRVYHFTTFGGTDDWWLIENLGAVYRCGNPEAGAGGVRTPSPLTPVNQSRAVALGPAAFLVLQDLYRSRQGLDPRYAQMAQRMRDRDAGYLSSGPAALESQRVLQEERDLTQADGGFAVDSVPDRPEVVPDSRVMFEEIQFRSPRSGLNRVWLNGLVEADRLTAARRPDGRFQYRVDARWTILDEEGEHRSLDRSFTASVTRKLGKDESLHVRLPMDLAPGRYRYTAVVRDGNAQGEALASGNYDRAELTVRDLQARTPALSDVAVAADSGGTWTPAPGVHLRPSPAHLTGPDGIAFVYFEAYNLSPGGTYRARVRMEPEEGESFDLSFPGDVPGGVGTVRRLLRLELDDTRPGPYRMTVTILDERSGLETLPHTTRITVNRPGS